MDRGDSWTAWLADEYDRFIKVRMIWYPRDHCWLMEGRLIPPVVMDDVREEVLALAIDRLLDLTPVQGSSPIAGWSARRLCAETLRAAWNASSGRAMLRLPGASESMTRDSATPLPYQRWQHQPA